MSRVVPGFPAYRVTRMGRVFSIQSGSWVLKRPSVAANGYLVVGLSNAGHEKTKHVHSLVLEAFVGPRPEGKEALHRDGNRTNPRLSNLRWGTRSENIADAILHGTATVGAANGGAKLTRLDVLWIVDMLGMKFTQKAIAKHFNVTTSTISRISLGLTYKREQANVV